MTSKKIIFSHGGGRFGNQLLNYIHLSAFGLEHKELSIKQNALNDYLLPKDGEFIVSNGKINLLLVNNIKKNGKFKVTFFRRLKNYNIRLAHFFVHYLSKSKSIIVGERGNNIGFLSGERCRNLMLNRDLFDSLNEKTLLAGWSIRNWQYVNKWKKTISQNLLNTLKQNDSQIINYSVGVHIRGTDFKSHANGTLFFENNEWVNAIEIIEKKLDITKVIIMSDELQDWDSFLKHHNNWSVSSGSFGEEGDMYDSFSDLLKCDIILTAGSTFALMAAWISNCKVIDISLLGDDLPIELMGFNKWSMHNNFRKNWK
jgi:hypothetical protein